MTTSNSELKLQRAIEIALRDIEENKETLTKLSTLCTCVQIELLREAKKQGFKLEILKDCPEFPNSISNALRTFEQLLNLNPDWTETAIGYVTNSGKIQAAALEFIQQVFPQIERSIKCLQVETQSHSLPQENSTSTKH